jgi:predicted phosphoadenosine phosphosulfate sulfurtransferase
MNVLEAAEKRLSFIFNEFDNVYVSFSGGKDSGVLLNLCLDYIRKHLPGRKLGVFHIDYEAQYNLTVEFVDKILAENSDIIEVYRVCVPFKVTTCTSMHQAFWRPWEEEKREIWVRQKPEGSLEQQDFPFFDTRMWDYEFQTRFSFWLHERKKAKRTCCLIGIRTQESILRWRAIHSNRKYRKYHGMRWTSALGVNVYAGYPIFDWITEDIWVANARFGWLYNRLYDVFYQGGVSLDSMRVASPFLSAAQDSLKLYKVIEPNTWGRLVSRVNGVNFTGIYGGTTAMGWKSIKLPRGHTWESYMYFLLGTLPPEARDGYLAKLKTSIKFWRERGGVLSTETIKGLRDAGVRIEVGEVTNYNTNKKPVRMEYIDDIDVTEFQLVPSYKRVCICIMKNDHTCKYMGFAPTKSETERRRIVMEKYKQLH